MHSDTITFAAQARHLVALALQLRNDAKDNNDLAFTSCHEHLTAIHTLAGHVAEAAKMRAEEGEKARKREAASAECDHDIAQIGGYMRCKNCGEGETAIRDAAAAKKRAQWVPPPPPRAHSFVTMEGEQPFCEHCGVLQKGALAKLCCGTVANLSGTDRSEAREVEGRA